MKKTITIMMLAMCFTLCLTSCAGRRTNKEEATATTSNEATEMAGEPASESSKGSDEIPTDNSMNLLAVIKTDPSAERWDVEVITNSIPITVDELGDGVPMKYTCNYTDVNGLTEDKTFENAAFLTQDFGEVMDAYFGYFNIEYRTEKIDGEDVRGCYLLWSEYQYVLKQTVAGKEIFHPLNIQVPYNTYGIYLEEMMDGKCLLEMGAYMYVCDMETYECTIIAQDILTSKTDGDMFYWADYDRTEHVIHWTESTESITTGNKVFYYRTESFQPERFESDSVNHDFEVMQMMLKSGEADGMTLMNIMTYIILEESIGRLTESTAVTSICHML